MGVMKRLKALLRDTSGNALAIGAAAMPLVIGGAGLAVDTVQLSLAKRELQRAADSAALAGAYAINQNPNSTAAARTTFATNGATRDLQLNNEVATTGTPVIQNAPSTGAFAGNANAVRVQLTANRTLSFLSFFDAAPTAVTVEATAAIVREGNFCMLALEAGNTEPGITVGGNATIDIGCGMSTNSRAAAAITATGSSSVKASPIMAVGGVPTGNFGTATRIPYSAVQADPFASVPNPSPSNCIAEPTSYPLELTPQSPGYNSSDGSFCFNGWDVDGAVTFKNFTQPVTIYVNGAGSNKVNSLNLGSKAHISGSNVTIVLTSTNATSDPSSIATFNMNSSADLDITAPTTGPYAGVAIYEDRRAPLRTIHFNGNSSSTLNGALYFPSARFYMNGTAGMQATCIQLVARFLDFSGNGTVGNSCSGGTSGSLNNFTATYVRLVG